MVYVNGVMCRPSVIQRKEEEEEEEIDPLDAYLKTIDDEVQGFEGNVEVVCDFILLFSRRRNQVER